METRSQTSELHRRLRLSVRLVWQFSGLWHRVDGPGRLTSKLTSSPGPNPPTTPRDDAAATIAQVETGISTQPMPPAHSPSWVDSLPIVWVVRLRDAAFTCGVVISLTLVVIAYRMYAKVSLHPDWHSLRPPCAADTHTLPHPPADWRGRKGRRHSWRRMATSYPHRQAFGVAWWR